MTALVQPAPTPDLVLAGLHCPPDVASSRERFHTSCGHAAIAALVGCSVADVAKVQPKPYTSPSAAEKALREAVAAMRRLLREPEREGIPGFADVCAALDALHRALWGPSGRLADRDAKGANR